MVGGRQGSARHLTRMEAVRTPRGAPRPPHPHVARIETVRRRPSRSAPRLADIIRLTWRRVSASETAPWKMGRSAAAAARSTRRVALVRHGEQRVHGCPACRLQTDVFWRRWSLSEVDWWSRRAQPSCHDVPVRRVRCQVRRHWSGAPGERAASSFRGRCKMVPRIRLLAPRMRLGTRRGRVAQRAGRTQSNTGMYRTLRFSASACASAGSAVSFGKKLYSCSAFIPPGLSVETE